MFVRTDTNDIYNLSLYQKLVIVQVPEKAPFPYALMALMPDCDYEKEGDCIVLSHHATHAEAALVAHGIIKQTGGGNCGSRGFTVAD
jgi:hypothetical protein